MTLRINQPNMSTQATMRHAMKELATPEEAPAPCPDTNQILPSPAIPMSSPYDYSLNPELGLSLVLASRNSPPPLVIADVPAFADTPQTAHRPSKFKIYNRKQADRHFLRANKHAEECKRETPPNKLKVYMPSPTINMSIAPRSCR